jgi:hypothetical protein
MNLHTIHFPDKHILFWVSPNGHTPCRSPRFRITEHHGCAATTSLRAHTIYCECPECHNTGWAHYIDTRLTRHSTRTHQQYYCNPCYDGNCPPVPQLAPEGYNI